MRQVAPSSNLHGLLEDEQLLGARLGNYRLEKLLGHGNRSAAYQAKDITSWEAVTVRVLDNDLSGDRAFVGRFRQAVARAMAVQHPHILPILYQGEAEGRVYIARPFVAGASLRERLGEPLPGDELLKIFRPIAQALDFAHAHGLVHGDLKPGNILFQETDATSQPLITDFGTAQALPSANSFIATARGEHFGTPEYVSPEQSSGARFDKRADLYAFGVMLYEAASGRPPFRIESTADTPRMIVMQHISTPVPPASSFCPEVSPAADRVFLRALAKRPEERYSSATELCAALAEVISSPVASADRLFGNSTISTIAAPLPPATVYIPRRQVRMRNRLRLALGAAAVIAVLLLAGGIMGSRQPAALSSGFAEPTPQPAPPASRDWYFATSWEGAGYRTVVNVYNPQSQVANLTLTFVGLDGTRFERTGVVGAQQRTEFDIGAFFPQDFATQIRAQHIRADLPVEVTHLIANTKHGTPISGATTEATSWRFLENRVPGSGDKWLEVANFRDQEAVVRVGYHVASGRSESKIYSVLPNTVLIVGLDQDFPRGIGRWQINVENSVPVVAEMTAYDKNGDIVANMIGEAVR